MRFLVCVILSLFVSQASAVSFRIIITWDQIDWSHEGDDGKMYHLMYVWEENKPEVVYDLGSLTPVAYNVAAKTAQYEYEFKNHGWVEGRTYCVQLEAYRIKEGKRILSGRSNTPRERIDYIMPKKPENITIEEKR